MKNSSKATWVYVLFGIQIIGFILMILGWSNSEKGGWGFLSTILIGVWMMPPVGFVCLVLSLSLGKTPEDNGIIFTAFLFSIMMVIFPMSALVSGGIGKAMSFSKDDSVEVDRRMSCANPLHYVRSFIGATGILGETRFYACK